MKRSSHAVALIAGALLIGGVVAGALLLQSGPPAGESAASYAQRACQSFSYSTDSSGTDPYADKSTLQTAIEKANTAANLAASAAKRDSRWEALAQGLNSTAVDLSTYLTAWQSSPYQAPYDKPTMNDAWRADVTSATRAVQAGCRKAHSE